MGDGQTDQQLSAAQFGLAFKGFLEQAVAQAPAPEPFFRQQLRAHFGADPTALPVVAEEFEPATTPTCSGPWTPLSRRRAARRWWWGYSPTSSATWASS